MYRIVLVSVLGFALTGCSDLSSRVTGLVSIDGKVLKLADDQRGTVMFRPVKGGPTATAIINDDGSYELSTGGARAIVPGDYLVAVRVVEIAPPAAGKSTPTGTPTTPALYADPLQSGLQFKVTSGSNKIDIDLDSDAGPIVPVLPEVIEEESPIDGESDESGDSESEGESTDDESSDEESGDTATDESAETVESPEEGEAEVTDTQQGTDSQDPEVSEKVEQDAPPKVTEDAPVKTEEKADDAS